MLLNGKTWFDACWTKIMTIKRDDLLVQLLLSCILVKNESEKRNGNAVITIMALLMIRIGVQIFLLNNLLCYDLWIYSICHCRRCLKWSKNKKEGTLSSLKDILMIQFSFCFSFFLLFYSGIQKWNKSLMKLSEFWWSSGKNWKFE